MEGVEVNRVADPETPLGLRDSIQYDGGTKSPRKGSIPSDLRRLNLVSVLPLRTKKERKNSGDCEDQRRWSKWCPYQRTLSIR